MRNILFLLFFLSSNHCFAWDSYGGNDLSQRYSPHAEINTNSVRRLKLNWTFDSSDFSDGKQGRDGTSSPQTTPLFVENKLIFCTPFNRVVALHPGSGKVIWQTQDVFEGRSAMTFTCRGVSYWKGREKGVCSSRILMGTLAGELKAFDVATGVRCKDFGKNGVVDLKDGLGFVAKGQYQVTSPPAIFENLVITGAGIEDNVSAEPASGVVRAYDVVTGELIWAWDSVAKDYQNNSWWKTHDSDPKKPYGDYTRGSPNVWAPIAVDKKAGLLFLPTGNPGADNFRGISRPGIDKFGSSVVAVNARTGEVVWSFKTVLHDIWDYDLSNQPALYDHKTENGETIPALAFGTKMGFVFLLNRLTGKPLFPLKKIAVPTDSVLEERVSPVQMIPTKPEPLLPLEFAENSVNLLFRPVCQKLLKETRLGGIFTPPTTTQTLQWPGPFGGTNWGGVSVDQNSNILIANLNSFGIKMRLVERETFEQGGSEYNSQMGPEPMTGTPYAVQRIPFTTKVLGQQIPCTPGPYGHLVAIDLKSGNILWRKPFGELYGFKGLPNMGGSLLTGGGLIFIGASIDKKFRAIDLKTGKQLWIDSLRFGGQATPMTYRFQGRQYVAINDGGHGISGPARGFRLAVYALQ